MSESFDAVEAFSDAAREAERELDAPCDLCLVFAGAPHLGLGKWLLSAVHEHLEPRHLIGCGAGGVVGAGREIEEGPAAVVWAASMPEARIATHHFEVEQDNHDFRVLGLESLGPAPSMATAADAEPTDRRDECIVVLADPYSIATEALLERLDELASRSCRASPRGRPPWAPR
jgi:small ligand-binding sensory domain FIST